MRVLLVGGGGREHALGWKLAQSRIITDLIAVPGNPGFAQLGACIPGIDILDTQAVVDLALANAIDLVVIGPEAPLAAGVVDALTSSGIRAYGPTRAGAQLESSKAFAKSIMRRAGEITEALRDYLLNRSDILGDTYDERYDDAVVLVTKSGQASISMVQRHLRIGYNRAARIIEMMEQEGIVGPQDGVKQREVLVRNYDDIS